MDEMELEIMVLILQLLSTLLPEREDLGNAITACTAKDLCVTAFP
jgi:hypothetical protein